MPEFHPPTLIQSELDAALERLRSYWLAEFFARRSVSLVTPYGQLITLSRYVTGEWVGDYPIPADVVESWIRSAVAFPAKLP